MSLDVPGRTRPETTSVTAEGGAERPALRRCTALPPERFADEVWSRNASLSRAAQLPSSFADLFSLEAADRVMSGQGLRTPFLRVARDGSTLPTTRFTSGGGVGAGVRDQVSDVQLTKLFAEGSTLVLQALHRTHGPIIGFAQALGADLGHPVQVNAYITPPQSQGFSSHYDVHDVFVLQISGEKRWRIHAPVLPAPLRDQPWTDHKAAVEAAAREEPLIDEVLRPGDALYLPRGYLHSAVALGETSVHLTVGVHVWTRRHLLEQLLVATGDHEDLRTTLPLGVDVTDPESLRAELTRTVDALATHLPGFAPERIAEGLTGAALEASRAAPVSPLAQATAAASVSVADTLRWRPTLTAVVRTVGEELVLRTPDGTVRLPLTALDVVSRLRGGALVPVRELVSEFGEAEGLELGRRLLTTCLAVLE